MTGKTAIFYGRVSDKKQVEANVSLPAQIEQGRRKAKELDANLLKIFIDEGKSGQTTQSRSEFVAAIEYCEIQTPDYFIVWSSSRFARNRYDAALYKRRLEKIGTRLVYISMSVDMDTDSGRLLDAFLEIIDEYKSAEISRDTRRSMIRNAEQGFWNGGYTPYGYRDVQDKEQSKRKRLEPNPTETPIIQKIFEMKAEGSGAKTIARILNQEGVTNRGRKWAPTTISTLLRNEVMRGYTVFGRKNRRTGLLQPKNQWIIIKAHDAIVDESLWNRVQAMLDRDQLNSGNGSALSQHLFTGLLTCACGSAMIVESAKGRNKRYWYYNCRAAMLDKAHAARRIPARELDTWLLDIIVSRLFNENSLRELMDEMAVFVNQWREDQSTQRKSAHARINALKMRIANILDVIEMQGSNAPNLQQLTMHLSQRQQELNDAEQSLKEIEHAKPPRLTVSSADLKDFSKFLKESIKTESPATARAFLAGFIRKVIIKKDEVSIDYNLAELANRSSERFPARPSWLPGPDSNQRQGD